MKAETCPPAFLVRDCGDGTQQLVDNRMVQLEWDLRRRGVGAEIIERVLRLNRPEEIGNGQMLRGVHRKPGRWWGFSRGLVQKGEVLRRPLGRAIWARIPRSEIRKDGRREWAPHWAVMAASGEVRLG